jgi:hypothetical protein
MTRQAKQGQLPRKQADAATIEGIEHDHDGQRDLHRFGDLEHHHDEDGRPVFIGRDGQPVGDGASYGTVPGIGYVPSPDAPVGGYFNGDNVPEQDAATVNVGEQLLGPGAIRTPSTRERLAAEASEIARRRPDAILTDNSHPEQRPMPGGSIGHIAAGTALEAMYGTPEDVADEKTHGHLAAQLLFEVAEQDWAHNRVGDAAKLVQVHALFHHMLGARGLLPTADELATLHDAGGES